MKKESSNALKKIALVFKAALFILLAAFLLQANNCKISDKNPSVLVITGGHSYDTLEFFNFFLSIENFIIDSVSQPEANKLLVTEEGQNYDVYVFYDMWQEISEEQKSAYLKLANEGKGFLFLHHSLVSYQDWPEFYELVGGRYISDSYPHDSIDLSNYRHDLDLSVFITDKEHPVNYGLTDFIIHDEGYSGLKLNNTIHPLLKTDNPDCENIIAWTNHYKNSDIIYLIFGHDKMAYQDEDFRLLVKNSLAWLSKGKK